MPNDDLGTFPMPPQNPVTPTPQPTVVMPPQAPVAPPSTPTPTPDPIPNPTFEETPDQIPSINQTPTDTPISSPILENEAETLVAANEAIIEKQAPQAPPVIEATPIIPPKPAEPSPVPATLPNKPKSPMAPIIILVLLLIAGTGLAASAFLFLQTGKLKNQLAEITQTLNKQQTTLTPSPSPTIFEIPTPSTNPSSTNSAIISPTTPPAPSSLSALQPLSQTANILQLAIKHSPNAQLILIKADNASDPHTIITKYFFREDLQTKKYFYISTSSNGENQVVDKQIYVTPDDNIPSLNDAILSNQLGLDLDEALKLTYGQCANKDLCSASPAKAQYIKTGSGIIWQISIYTQGLSATPLTIQINAETKIIIYQSPEFANK